MIMVNLGVQNRNQFLLKWLTYSALNNTYIILFANSFFLHLQSSSIFSQKSAILEKFVMILVFNLFILTKVIKFEDNLGQWAIDVKIAWNLTILVLHCDVIHHGVAFAIMQKCHWISCYFDGIWPTTILASISVVCKMKSFELLTDPVDLTIARE